MAWRWLDTEIKFQLTRLREARRALSDDQKDWLVSTNAPA